MAVKKPKKPAVFVNLSTQQLARLKREAKDAGRSMAAQIRYIYFQEPANGKH